MNRPATLVFAGAIVTVAIGLIFVALDGARPRAATFRGTELQPPRAAPEVALPDHRGHDYSLRAVRGRAVALTFLYTGCADVCPYLALKLSAAERLLGDSARIVDIVIVSTDPEGDTPERVASYLARLGAGERWHYLTGARAQLADVWAAYLVTAQNESRHEHAAGDSVAESFAPPVVPPPAVAALAASLTDQQTDLARALANEFAAPGHQVTHISPIWLVDRSGWLRVHHGEDSPPEAIASDLHELVSERY